MDLNIENYSISELLNIFNIEEQNSDNETLQKHLSKSISIITNQANDSLPENKNELIEFYTKSAFKILNNKTIINNNIKKETKKEIIEK